MNFDQELAKLSKRIDTLSKAKKVNRSVNVKYCGPSTLGKPANYKVVRVTNYLALDVGTYLTKEQLQYLVDSGITVNVSQNT